MPSNRRQMHLALYLDGTGNHISGWRLPEARLGPEDFGYMTYLTELAEAAKFDMSFVADAPVSGPGVSTALRLEAMTLIAALAGVTEHIGLAATVSTTYSEPYNVARMLASIDLITGGRVAWNVVTTSNAEAAGNYGKSEHAGKEDRYEMAEEFVTIAKGLWDSWADDAIVNDKTTGQWVDLAKRRPLNHVGKHYKVKGPLNLSRSPQGQPVIIQAGASDTGLPFAARQGEVIFTVQGSIEASKAFADRIRTLAAEAGRDPQRIIIMPGFSPFIAETEEKAKEVFWSLSDVIDEKAAWDRFNLRMGMDMTGLDPEGPVPEIPWEEARGHAKTLLATAKRYGFNVRQLRDYTAAGAGHPILFGTPEMIADELQQWFEAGAADGFVLLPSYVPQPVEAFTKEVVPILQKRGLFRTEYSGHTLREHLNLPRPARA